MTVSAPDALDRVASVLGLDGFSDDPGERAVEFMSHLPAIHGEKARRGEPMGLMPWEEELVRQMFGALNPDGTRQYRTVYLEIPRKNGKSTLSAMIMLYSLLVDREPGGEIYSVAYTTEQARIVFNAASHILRCFPDDFVAMDVKPNSDHVLRVSNYYGTMEHLETHSMYRVLAANKVGNYGLNPHLALFDELHVQKTRQLWDVMRTAMGARQEPILIAITTAGHDKTSICYQVHEYAKKVLSGEVEQPTFLARIFSADPDDNWSDEAIWKKANPSLGVTKTMASMREEFREAQEMPAAQNTFKREHLNIWTDQETAWIPREQWDACGDVYDLERFEGGDCFGGLDMASKFDLTAHIQLFRDEDLWYCWPHFWMPGDRVDEWTREHGIPYADWVKDGFIKATPGNSVDYETVEEDIKALAGRFRYIEVGADDYNSEAVLQKFVAAGIQCVAVPQTFKGMNEGCKEFAGLVQAKKIRHPKNPVLDWCMRNVQIRMDSATQHIRPVRPSHDMRLKIDGVVALVMALGRAILHQNAASLYDSEDFEPVYVEVA